MGDDLYFEGCVDSDYAKTFGLFYFDDYRNGWFLWSLLRETDFKTWVGEGSLIW